MLLAIHLSDGVLSSPWWIAGFVVAAILLGWSSRHVVDDEIPRVALLTAAFFVSSLIHMRLGPVSVHLLLTGLVGVVLGRRAPLAITVGLTLQAILLGHGGYTTLGLNIDIMTLPALASWLLFNVLRRVVAFFWAGLITGIFAVIATCAFNASVLIVAGLEDYTIIAGAGFLAHLPLAAIEGIVLGTTAAYLAKVKPEMLGIHKSLGEPTN